MLPDGFLAFINEHRLFSSTDRVLLAVSGGIDSMVLADLLQQNAFLFSVAHVNFGLREAASDEDAAFVENMAHSYGVPFHLTRFNTRDEATRHGKSIQETARQLRYAWFRQLQTEHGYAAVATAHHLNDVLETMLLNMTRGTGLAGLRGMPIQSVGSPVAPRVVRPLWFATRSAIDTYARGRALAWRDDASNALDTYSRNKLRHHVVPVLEQINPGLMHTLPRSLSQLRAAEHILQETLSASFEQCTTLTDEGFIIRLTALSALSEPLFRLGDWLRPYGFTPDVLAQCWRAVDPNRTDGQQGQVFLAPAYRLLHDQGALWLLPHRPAPAPPIHLPAWPAAPLSLGQDGQLTVQLLDRTDWDGQWPTDPVSALLDADALPWPLTLRPWRERDRFTPLGMRGSRLISDFLADCKLPLRRRERVWVLECDGRILWVVGLRVAHEARITQNTTRIVRLSWRTTNSDLHAT